VIFVTLLAAIGAFTVPAASPEPPLAPDASVQTWASAAPLALTYDVGHARAAEQPTAVHVSSDGKFIYVRFDAQQSSPVAATQRVDDTIAGGSNINGGIAWSDDAVWVDLWPTGPAGFQYQFESNPIGTHNEASSENASFSPHWVSRGVVTSSGYTVTMAIPLAVIHGAHAGQWRLQFVRYVRSTGALDVWSYDSAQSNPDDASRAGDATFTSIAKPPLPKPRLAPYALGEAASRPIGGATSRVGMDFSIPVAQTAAFFGTFHPDYSNVELDQQSISPTVYQRTYSEVRPFFTQAANYYDDFNCSVCNGFRTTLYTPAIPTPSQGYAFEGRQGDYGFAAFDAIGDDRTDAATALNYTSPDTHWNGAFQHVITDIPGIIDTTNQAGLSWYNGKYLSFYANDARESGTLVTDPSQGEWFDAGGGWGNQHFALYGSVRKVGSQFDPVDGFDSHPGVAGYGFYTARVWTFDKNDVLSSVGADLFLDRYQGTQYGQAQSDTQVLLDVLAKDSFDLQLFSGSNYWRFGQDLEPVSQSAGFQLTYHSGSQNNLNNFPAHGSSATPTQISYNTGRYGLGRLDTWYRTSTIKVGDRGLLTLAVDNTAQWLNGNGADNIQWFDSISYTEQLNRNSSFSIGIRRVQGNPPEPNGGGDCVGTCSNVSLAYHLRLKDYEFYVAYGDPNTLVTVPQAIFKVIFYAGAQKGT
jgi:hypothetical protein